MARLNKFASVNLNDSYGKPDRGGSNNSSSNGNSSSSGKPRISSPGGMLILSRPGRSLQPPASPSPKPGQARLGIPSPVNLPSLKRETTSGDTQLAASPPIAGWIKAESPPLSGWTKVENPSEVSPLQQKAGLSRSLDTVGESLKAMPTGKPDVYAPPAMRAAAMQTGSAPRVLPPAPPQLEQKPSAIIRVEEFPTLQAAVARPPTPPQHFRQKDLHQKQREKQLEAKEQQLKLQQLSQGQGVKPAPIDVSHSVVGSPQPQPAVLSLRPLGKPEASYQKATMENPVPDSSANSHSSNVYSDGSLSWSAHGGSIGMKGSSSLADRSLSRSPPTGLPSQGSLTRVDEARANLGHNLRPQYRNPLPVSQSSPNGDVRQSGFQNLSESLWLPPSRRDLAPSPRIVDHSKPAGNSQRQDMGRVPFEVRGAPPSKESFSTRDGMFSGEGNASVYVREDTYMEQGGLSREGPDPRVVGPSSTLGNDGIPRIEGFQSQHSLGREIHDRESREGFGRVIRDPGSREIISDSHGKVNRENASRDRVNIYDPDVKEANSRDSRNVYTRDVKEVYNQGSPISKHIGYSYPSSANGDNSWRGYSGHVDAPYGKGSPSPVAISPTHSPRSAHDFVHGGKRYGSQGTGDQTHAREARIGFDLRTPRAHYSESALPYSSTQEMIGSRKVRSPGPTGRSFDPVKEVHEVFSERPQRIHEERPVKFEDKVIDKRGVVNDSFGSNFLTQRPVVKRDSGQGRELGTRALQIDSVRKLDDERLPSLDEVKKKLPLEDERRKEAAKLKLMELEERIAKRALEGQKDEVDTRGKESLEVASRKQHGYEEATSNTHYDSEGVLLIQDRDIDRGRREEDPRSRLVRPSSASAVPSRTYKGPSERLFSNEERDLHMIVAAEKVVRSRSPSSWRKEMGNGPTSKLFSSPYIESGGFRRPSDGGTYKLS